MAGELAGKTALVTGGAQGLGQAIAQRLAAAGALVAVTCRSVQEPADETLANIAAAGGQAFAIEAQLSGAQAAERLAQELDTELERRTGAPGIDILVNVIGGTPWATIEQVTEAIFDEVFANNVRGGFFLTRALHHRIRDFGRVINISSAGARLTDPGIITYTMAKAAVDAFTRVLAQELGPRGITVNAVAPGFTAGPTNAGLLGDPVASGQVMELTALKRFGQPEEIADTVFALASPLGRWVTAQVVEASGGFKL